ncbi:Macrolide export protein MacA [Caulifigura coniformis]|uniref:Macrolide export protein MacA n=1 Tax=Caulifigura coniformis TaxID=2527983 RepID=A0A517SGR0_9PLAN|nr:HlyD family efflux transporter periplasmic adaptor subunit [Caulifigura coniformis]QDT55300.1 Macrolide export protein MacA [Caulifigura coniformis]
MKSTTMFQGRRMRGLGASAGAAAMLLLGASSPAAAQFGAQPAATPAAKPVEGKPAIIERAPLILRDSTRFQIPLKLDAAKSVRVSARVDGVVATILTRLGDRIQTQAEVARLESQERQLELARAQAALRAAQAERTANTGNAAGVADARIEEAKASVELAALRLDYCNLRSPLTGIVTQLHVTEGQFVRAGEPIATVVDPTKLRIDVPVDSKTVTAGGTVQILVEDQPVTGTVEAIVPLNDRFEPLRDLFLSISSGVLAIDNSGGKFKVGQTAYSPMIPRQAVTEVPTSAISNAGDGERKVQVIRDGIVRDIRIQPLGQQGEAYVFVSGRFGVSDELVLKSSEPLLDGARVVAAETAAPAAGASKPDAPRPSSGSSF